MRYRNKRTGIEYDFPCPVAGADWEPAAAPDPVPENGKAEKPEKAVKNGGNRKKQLRDGR